MQNTEQFAPCFEALKSAREVHKKARGIKGTHPRVDKYLESSLLYQQAANLFANYSQTVNTFVDKKRAEAWQNYCLSMMYGDKANGRYFNPSAERQSIIDDAVAAITHIVHAQEIMPWGEVEQRDELVRWKILQLSFKGLMHRATAQKLQQESKFKEAAEEFLVTADTHSKAAALAESLGDQASYQRIMARALSATSSTFDCRASMSKGKEQEKYLREAANAIRQAIQFRPQWTPLQHLFQEVVLKQEQLEREKGKRVSWVQFLVGFLLGLATDLILSFLF